MIAPTPPPDRNAITTPPPDLSATVGPLTLPTPVLVASGCGGYGQELADLLGGDLAGAGLGGIVGKSISREPMPGNPPPRVAETPAGMINAIGLQNKGIERFLREDLPVLRSFPGVAAVVSLFGHAAEDYVVLTDALGPHAEGIAAIELNVSCPNTAKGGLEFGADPVVLRALVERVRPVVPEGVSLWVKLTPNVTDIVAEARAAVAGGADALSLVNTVLGMGIDWQTRKPRVHGALNPATGVASGMGGLSGPCIKPLAVAATWRVHRALPDTPLIAMGGIATADDVLEFTVAGASAVQVGTALMVDPSALSRIVQGLRDRLAEAGIRRLRDLIGTVAPWTGTP